MMKCALFDLLHTCAGIQEENMTNSLTDEHAVPTVHLSLMS